MDENNKEFQSVIGSVILHLILVLSLYFVPDLLASKTAKKESVVEVDFVEKRSPRWVIRSLTKPSDLPPEQTRFLSSQQQRVKKESVSPKLGEDKNAYRPSKIKNFGIKKQDLKGNILNVPNDLATLEYTQDLQSQFSFRLDKIKHGSLTLLNSDYSVFASFYDRINPSIRYDWLKGVSSYLSDPVIPELLKMNKDQWVARVEVFLDNKGNFIKSVLVNSSGSKQLDLAATNAFREAAPFLNPPEGMVGEDGKIHLRYVFVVALNPRYFARTKKQ